MNALAQFKTLLAMLLICASARGASITLAWNQATGTNLVYRVYRSDDTGPFILVGTTPGATMIVATSANISRFYVTSFSTSYQVPESVPSNTVTNSPPAPPVGLMVLSKPVLSTTNIVLGAQVTATATISNGTSVAYALGDAGIVALPPGADSVGGPFYEFTPRVPAQSIEPGIVLNVPGTWLVTPTAPTGQWRVYLAAKNTSGAWLPDGPITLVTVSAAGPIPGPPPAPTNLRSVKVQGTRWDLSWSSLLTASTEVERSTFSGPFQRITTVAAGTQHTPTTIKPKTDYAFRVRAVDANGASPYSNTNVVYSRN